MANLLKTTQEKNIQQLIVLKIQTNINQTGPIFFSNIAKLLSHIIRYVNLLSGLYNTGSIIHNRLAMSDTLSVDIKQLKV